MSSLPLKTATRMPSWRTVTGSCLWRPPSWTRSWLATAPGGPLTAMLPPVGAWDGVPYTADEWISEVYVHADDRWRCLFSQKTPAPP
jgi:hypothetical protein